MLHLQLNTGQQSITEQVQSFVDALSFPRNASSPPPAEFLIGGYAGTGKTTMLSAIADIATSAIPSYGKDSVDEDGQKILSGECKLGAPTNKAAKRLRAKTRRKVSTIHALLGALPRIYLTSHIPELKDIVRRMQAQGKSAKAIANLARVIELLTQIKALEDAIESDTLTPPKKRDAETRINRLQEKLMDFPAEGGGITHHDILLIDESSMVGGDLRKKLIDKNPAAIIWVGDPAQLDPVKAKCWFNPPSQSTLTEIVRQDADSGILKLATLIRQGNTDTRHLSQLVTTPDVKFVFGGGFTWEEIFEVYGDRWITYRNGLSTLTHNFHTKNLNTAFRRMLGFPDGMPQPGDRLYVNGSFTNMCTTLGKPIRLHKGDELIVKSVSTTGDLESIALNGCLAIRRGFEAAEPHNRASLSDIAKQTAPKKSAGTLTQCHCHLFKNPSFCSYRGRKHNFRYVPTAFTRDPALEHPWRDIASQSQGLFLTAETRPEPDVNDPGGLGITTLLDPRDLLWDENQRNAIGRVERYWNKECNGNLHLSKSPIKAVLQAKYGYALTAHQAQGSEWDSITVFWDAYRTHRDPVDARKWLYTAVTRARKRVCIVTI